MPRFIPRQRKQKARDRRRGEVPDTNPRQILPETKTEKEAKRQKLRNELRAGQSSVSSKKQKRLDKYIVSSDSKDVMKSPSQSFL